MATLTGNLISSTYPSLLKITTNNTASANLNNITDGVGNATALSLATATASIAGNLVVTGTLNATASNAVSSSYAGTALTASFALVASTAPAYLLTSSFNASTGSYLRTGSNTFVGNQIVTGSIIPGGLTYDLGSTAAPWQELYVSTGSIKFVDNGVVVSTLGAGTNGTQITGSLNISGSIRVGSYGNIQETSNALHTYNQAGQLIFGSLSQSAATQDNYISFNGAPYTAASTTAVTIWGSNTGDGPVLFLNRKSSTGREDTGYTPWTIGVGQAGTSTPEALYVGTGNTFLNRSIEFNYKGLNTNILFSGSGIIPATANTYDLGTVDKPWRELYVSTGSINFVNNGAVVSTLGAGTDGTQISGSVLISGSLNNGVGNYSTGIYSHAEGYYTSASGYAAHSEGDKALAVGFSSHAEGYQAMASASYSHAEGDTTVAKGQFSHAEGTFTLTSGLYSHAEGLLATSSADYSHAEGMYTTTLGRAAHAEGSGSRAVTKASHAEGILTIAYGTGSHAEGINTIASGSGQHVQGKFNLHGNTTSLMVIGDGTDDSNRHDLLRAEVGVLQVTGSLAVSSSVQVLNLGLTPQSQPASPATGQIYFDTNDSHFYGWNGTTWKQLDN